MEPTLVLQTHSFALRLYALLRTIDPARLGQTRKQVLHDELRTLESDVQSLYRDVKARSEEWDNTPIRTRDLQRYPLRALPATLERVGTLLSQIRELPSDFQLSYFKLYGLRKQLQKAYQRLSLILEACQAPVPQIRPSNLKRSLFHSASGLAVLLMIALVPSFSWMFWIALAYFIFCWSTEGLKRLHPDIKARVMKFFAPIAHPHEYDKVNSATWYGVALLILSLINEPVGVIAVAVLGFADPAAALIGRRYGKIPMPGNRSLEGSLTFFIVGTVAAAVALTLMHPIGGIGKTLMVSAVAALCGAIGEYAGKYPDDNLTIPLAAAAGAWPLIALLP
jgi:dolichol kinase